MATTYQSVNVATKYTDGTGAEKTRFVRVGTLFFNTRALSIYSGSYPAAAK